MNPDCWPRKGVPSWILGIRNKEYMQNTGFYTSAFAILDWTTPQEGGREYLCPHPQNNSGRSHPAWAKFWMLLPGPRCSWGLAGRKGVPSPCGTSLEGIFALGKEMLQAMGKFQCWLPQPLPVGLYLVFKAFLVFLFSKETELIFTAKFLLIFF